MNKNHSMVNICRMFVCVGIVLIQVSGANAQFGDMGNLLNKKLNKLNKPADQQPPAVSDVTTTAQPSAAVSGAITNSQLPAANPENTTETAAGNSGTNTKAVGVPKEKSISGDGAASLNLPPLFEAARSCDEVRFSELLKKDMSEINYILRAVWGDPSASNRYVDDRGKPIPKAMIEFRDKYNEYTLLQFAAENGCTNIIKQLLDAGAKVNCTRPHAPFPVILATRNGHLEAVKMLLKAGADESFVIPEAKAANQNEIAAYFTELEKARAAVAAEESAKKAAALAEVENAKSKEINDKREAASQIVKKKILDILDHPKDLFGIENSRYRKFNGKVYDCAEPIDFLNRADPFAFLDRDNRWARSEVSVLYEQLTEGVKTQVSGLVEAEKKWLNENPWSKVNCCLRQLQVEQVIPDGLIVQLNDRSLALLKNYPKEKKCVDGDLIPEEMFVMATGPYQYTGVLGAIRTIHSYDFGVVVEKPWGSINKLPLPKADN